ncbi:MAG: hypothetical protein Q7R95_09235 [bacterium]|nr:hypothetical protein [bacterium]
MTEKQAFNLSVAKEKLSKFVNSLTWNKQSITQVEKDEKPDDLLNEVDLTKTNIVTKTEGRAFRGPFVN